MLHTFCPLKQNHQQSNNRNHNCSMLYKKKYQRLRYIFLFRNPYMYPCDVMFRLGICRQDNLYMNLLLLYSHLRILCLHHILSNPYKLYYHHIRLGMLTLYMQCMLEDHLHLVYKLYIRDHNFDKYHYYWQRNPLGNPCMYSIPDFSVRILRHSYNQYHLRYSPDYLHNFFRNEH